MEQLSVKSIALPGTSQKQRSFLPDGDYICNIFSLQMPNKVYLSWQFECSSRYDMPTFKFITQTELL